MNLVFWDFKSPSGIVHPPFQIVKILLALDKTNYLNGTIKKNENK